MSEDPDPDHLKFIRDSAEEDLDAFESAALRRLRDTFKPLEDEWIGLLYTIAGLEQNDFVKYKADRLLRWILRGSFDKDADRETVTKKLARCLHWQPEIGEQKTPLHRAIQRKNHGFMYCVLAIADELADENSAAIDVEIVTALRARDDNASNTCLLASIQEQLPCVPEMVRLCAKVRRNKETRLKAAIEERHRTQENLGQSLELKPIFLMATSKGETPLHKLMEISAENKKKTVPRVLLRTRIGENGGPPRSEYTSTNPDFGPQIVIKAMIDELGDSMGDMWTAVNKKGESPYERRLSSPLSKALTFAAGDFTEDWGKAKEEAEKIADQYSREAKIREVKSKTIKVTREKEFRKMLKDNIFRTLTEIPRLKKALYGVNGQEKELCLDMSDFNQSSHNFTTFVDELVTKKGILFDECLLAVYLPDMNNFKKTIPYDGVPKLFEWLRTDAGVERLKSLNIPDSTTSPMSDELMAQYIVNQFKIEKFNWHKLDINLDLLVRSPHRDEFTDITLYSSGNYGALYHWISPKGLEKLVNLRMVRIEIMELNPLHKDEKAEKKHKELLKDYANELDQYLDAMKTEKEKKPGVTFDYEIDTGFEFNGVKWDFPAPRYMGKEADEKLEILKRLDACKDHLKQKKEMLALGAPYWTRFEELRAPKGSDSTKLIKVAIIDNGVDRFRQEIRDAIDKGISFVTADSKSTDRFLPWWMVSDPHGTQMASLINQANPWCRLYIARVGKSRKDILPDDAVEAINWAIEQNVDIISMSWITKGSFPALQEAVKKAAEKCLVFCSTADEGIWSSGNVYPAFYPGTVRVSATDKYGNLMPASAKEVDAINIPVPGQHVPALGPSYMGEQIARGTVSGSSVATALAAGMASLALMMLRVFNDKNREQLHAAGFYTNKGIVDVLSKMNDPKKPLFPAKANMNELAKRWDFEALKADVKKALEVDPNQRS